MVGRHQRGLVLLNESNDLTRTRPENGWDQSPGGTILSRRLPVRQYDSVSPSATTADGDDDEYDFNSWQGSRSRPSITPATDDHSSSGSSSASSISVDEDVYGPLSRFCSGKPMLDVFVQRFVDAFSPEVDTSSGRAGAIRAAAEIRMFSPMISNAFEAVSVTFFGRSVQDSRAEAAGMKLYPRVLRSLQDALLDPERSRSEATLVTVTLLLAFESIERTSQDGVSAHVKGATQLIQHRGPENHMYGVEHLLFTELRPYWVCLLIRKFTFHLNSH